jgi:hypothetical protein
MLATMPRTVEVLRDQQRAGLQSMDDERAEQQRHHDVRRNAERHQWNECATRGGIVRGFGTGNTPIAPLPNRSGVLDNRFSSA